MKTKKNIVFTIEKDEHEIEHKGEKLLSKTTKCYINAYFMDGKLIFPSIDELQEVKHLVDNYLLKAMDGK